MTDVNNNQIKVGDYVKHRFKQYTGTIEKIEDGCNPICWVDFGEIISNKKHLTICCKYDIIKN